MFNQRDTALESFAEQMRAKKRQGTFNAKALLAAIAAGDDDEEERAEAGK